MTNLRQRIEKAEDKVGADVYNDREYIEALKKHYSGEDNGESLARLPSLVGAEPKHRLALLCVHALHELDMEKEEE